MRGPEVPLAKPPGVFRIAGLGDSQMFGWGVGDDEVYLRRLEVLLNARARAAGDPRRFEVLNFAVPGYNAVMEVATFEHKALAFAPDLMIVHFVRNDLDTPHFAAPPRSYLLAVLRGALAGTDQGEEGDAEPDTLRRARRRADRSRFAHLGGPEAYARAMARLADLSRRRGIPVLVTTLERVHPLMREAVHRHGLRFVHAAPRFYAYLGARGLARKRGAWAQTFRNGRDGHPNALAHRLFAEVLLEELAASGVVGR
ncbi:MAG TPA: SGNH/GDSL hydrolase family protein [Thermoanaerobaculia bacterium]